VACKLQEHVVAIPAREDVVGLAVEIQTHVFANWLAVHHHTHCSVRAQNRNGVGRGDDKRRASDDNHIRLLHYPLPFLKEPAGQGAAKENCGWLHLSRSASRAQDLAGLGWGITVLPIDVLDLDPDLVTEQFEGHGMPTCLAGNLADRAMNGDYLGVRNTGLKVQSIDVLSEESGELPVAVKKLDEAMR